MPIPTELVGSLPRPLKLQDAYEKLDDGEIDVAELQEEQEEAAEDSIRRLEATGENLVTDGEQRESSFATYSLTTRSPGRASPTTSRATASTSRSSTTATTASCPG